MAQRPRIDWYQTDAYVSVSVFVKGVAEASAGCVVDEADGRGVAVTFAVPDSEPQSLELRLAHPVAADGVQLSVKPTRLDLRLTKLQPGLRWPALEGNCGGDALAAVPPAVAAPAAVAVPATAAATQPQHKAKNWDAIAKSIEDDKPEGDAALNELFQKIYSDGSDEQRKAMEKSFRESGGTVLSTNWAEVGKAKVEVKPPDGMEYRKWDT